MPSLRTCLAPFVLAAGLHSLGAQTPAVVRTVTPSAATAERTYELPGRTEPFEAAHVFTRATGVVRERAFDIGDRVKAGDVLAVIDAPEVDRAVDAARASLVQATTRYESARRLSDRSASLLASNAISQDELDQRNATTDEARAAVEVARANLARLEEQQRFATVRAPFDAVIAGRNFDRGDRVRGDSATAEGWLYRLVRLDTLRFVINAAPDIALRLTEGRAVAVRFSEFPGRSFAATVSRSSRVFDPAAGTMRIELTLDNRDLTLPAGLTGRVVLTLPPTPDTFLLPTNTLLVRNGQNTVATVRDGKVAFVDVAPGRNLGNQVEVTSAGLAADSVVIINPNALLRPGDQVELAPRTAAR